MTKAKTLKILATALALSAAIAVTVSCGEKADTTPQNYKLVGNKICLADGTEAGLDNQYVTIDGNVYYVVSNEVVTGTRVIDGRVCTFREDGRLTNEKIYNFEFVRIGDATYYAVNNQVVVSPCTLDGRPFGFDKNGKITSAPEGRVSVCGKTYFFKDKNILTNHAEFIVVSEDVVIDGVYLARKGERYLVSYDEYGVMKSDVADNAIANVDGDDYYIVKGKVYVDGGFILHEEFDEAKGKTVKRLYHFAKDSGKMDKNTVVDGYLLGANGAAICPSPEVKVTYSEDGNTYLIIDDIAVPARKLEGKISVSNTSLGQKNNGKTPIDNVTVEITEAEYSYKEKTDSNGKFSFGFVPAEACKLLVTKTDYIPVTLELEDETYDNISIVIDKDVKITLSGVVSEADLLGFGANDISGAKAVLTRTSSTNQWIATAETGKDGSYVFTGLTPGVYELNVTKDGYVPLKQILTVTSKLAPSLANFKLEMVAVTPEYSEKLPTGNASGVVTDKETGKGIAGLTIYVAMNFDDLSESEIPFTITENGVDKVVTSCTTDENGAYEIKNLTQGYYTLLIVDNRDNPEGGYYAMSRGYIKIFSLGHTLRNQNFVLSK